jgi:hypothetical protein
MIAKSAVEIHPKEAVCTCNIYLRGAISGIISDHGGDGMEEQQREEIQRRIIELRTEHRDLDEVIERLTGSPLHDQLQLQRMKKRKLQLKDYIARMEAMLVPDIIA